MVADASLTDEDHDAAGIWVGFNVLCSMLAHVYPHKHKPAQGLHPRIPWAPIAIAKPGAACFITSFHFHVHVGAGCSIPGLHVRWA